MRKLIPIILILLLTNYSTLYAEEELSTKDVLFSLLQGKSVDPIIIDKVKIGEELKTTFGVTAEDLAFIHSIRAARLPIDGFDFLRNTKDLIQLVTIYLEAKEEWKKPMTTEFYDFFRIYCMERLSKSYGVIEDTYQVTAAKKRFKLPY